MPKSKEPKRTLTDRFIKGKGCRVKSGKTRTLFFDAVVPGLAVRVTNKGAKTFVLVKRFPGSENPTPRELAKVGAISLEKARSKARDWLELLRKGLDPAAEEERQRKEELRKQKHTFLSVAEDYIQHIHREKQRKAADVERRLRREYVSRWNSRPITSITDDDARDVINEILKRDAKYEAHNVFGDGRTLFVWAIGRGGYGLTHSPFDRLKPGKLIGKREPRQRVLEDSELRAFSRATRRMGYPFGSMFRMLALTGQRKSEVSDARWRELGDLDAANPVWTVPPERFKSNAMHLVPLTADVVALLRELPRFKKGDYLFSTTFGAKPVDGFSKAKARLDGLMLEELRAEDPGAELPPFVIHDLRRTVRTRLSAVRVSDTVAEMVIGHGRKGMQRVYDEHKYVDEMREALKLWNTRLRDIVEPVPDNVVSMAASLNR